MVMKIIIVGSANSGKTELCRLILDPDSSMRSEYKASIAADFLVRNITTEKDKLVTYLWDLAGNSLYKETNKIFAANSDLIVYCIDLSQAINEDKMKEMRRDLQQMTQINPTAPLILVGTKCDLLRENSLEQLKEKLHDFSFVMTAQLSVKTKEGLLDFIETLDVLAQKADWIKQDKNLLILRMRRQFDQDSAMYHALTDLYFHSQNLSKELIKTLDDKTSVLVNGLKDCSIQNKIPCIETYLLECDELLRGTHHNLKSVLLSVAIAAVVFILAFFIGFAVGYTLGAWAGPLAFFTGLAAGTASAITVTVGASLVGLGSFGYSAYRFFEMTPVEASIHEVGVQAKLGCK